MVYDLIIVGAGPAGLSASLRAKELNLDNLVLERRKIGNLFLEKYPAGKVVSDFPKETKVKGKLWFEKIKLEDLLAKWRGIGEKLNLREGEEVVEVRKKGGHFAVKSNKNNYESKAVVMALGKEGKPRKLGVNGEELNKVFYSLKDPKEWKGKNILVVGGGDSAADMALCLCENNEVIISYRKPDFFRLNPENLSKVERKCKHRELEVIFKSTVKEIREKSVALDIEGQKKELENDAIFILAGAELPIDFFKKIKGVETKEDKVVLDEHFQSSVNGLYVVGDAAGKPPYLIKPAINQGYEVVNVISSNF